MSQDSKAIVDDQTKQKGRVLSYKSPDHDIPGDYNMAPGSVPPAPGGIEHFYNISSNRIHHQVAYANLLVGVSLIFTGLVTMSRLMT